MGCTGLGPPAASAWRRSFSIVKILRTLGWLLVALAVFVPVAGYWGLFAGSPPTNLGVTQGRLRPPSMTPNSVSSQAALYPDHPQRAYASMEPLGITGDPAAAMKRLAAVLRQLDGTTVLEEKGDYIRAESATPVLGFKDDLEFWADPASGVIHFRSASRLGRKDFGVNRARIESIRARLLQN